MPAVRFRRSMLNGHPGNVTWRIKRAIVRAHNAGLEVTSTTGGSHATTSYHYTKPKGRAVDVAGPWSAMERFQWREYRRFFRIGPWKCKELFGPINGLCIKNGRRLTLAEGSALESNHDTHVHISL